MRVLISRLSAMGDVVCTLPVAVAFKESFPGCHVTWAVQHNFAPIVERCTAVDEVVKVRGKGQDFIEDLRQVGQLEPFDVALDAQGLSKSALVVFKSKAKRKLGYHWQREVAPLFSQRVRPDVSSIHVVDQYVDVARAAGCQASRAEFRLEPKTADFEAISEFQPKSKYAVIHPGGGWASKRWAATHFAEICKELIDKEVQPVLIGTQPEEEAAEEIKRLVPAVTSLVGKTNLGSLIALVKGCKIHIGGDTGSTHLAAAMGVTAVGIYLVTRPQRSCPYGQISHCPEPTLQNINQMVQSLL